MRESICCSSAPNRTPMSPGMPCAWSAPLRSPAGRHLRRPRADAVLAEWSGNSRLNGERGWRRQPVDYDSTTNVGTGVSTGGSGTAQLVVHPDCSVNMATDRWQFHYVGVARLTEGHIGLYLVGTDPESPCSIRPWELRAKPVKAGLAAAPALHIVLDIALPRGGVGLAFLHFTKCPPIYPAAPAHAPPATVRQAAANISSQGLAAGGMVPALAYVHGKMHEGVVRAASRLAVGITPHRPGCACRRAEKCRWPAPPAVWPRRPGQVQLPAQV